MKRFHILPVFVIVLAISILSVSEGFAQSDFDLMPPIQRRPASLSLEGVQEEGKSLNGTFQFGVAEINDDGHVDIITMSSKTVPVDKDAPVESVVQSYTVMVPRAKEVDGKPVTEMVPETRTRTVSVVRGPKKTVAVLNKQSVDVAKIEYNDINGKKLSTDEVKRKLAERIPVVLLTNKDKLQPYFKSLMKEETIFIIRRAIPRGAGVGFK